MKVAVTGATGFIGRYIVRHLAEGGHEGARQLASYFVGQGVGLMNSSVSARTVVYEFMQDFLQASERLQAFTAE